MSFREPVYLLAALAVPLFALLFVLARRRRRRYAVRFPAASVLATARGNASSWRRWLAPAMLALAACAMAVAMARPQTVVAVPIERASVALVTDTSGSMAATDVDPTRLDAARGAVRSFLDKAPEKLLVGFQSYSSGIGASIAPTSDRDELRATLDGLQADGGTATGDALMTVLDQLEARRGRDGRRAPSAIVLLSDGKTTQGSDPIAAATRARRLGIPIYTVALGTPDGVVEGGPFGEPVAVPPDPETLREIATQSKGEAFEVDEAAALDHVYEALGSKIGTRKQDREITSGFAGGALVLLLGGLSAGLRWRPRPT